MIDILKYFNEDNPYDDEFYEMIHDYDMYFWKKIEEKYGSFQITTSDFPTPYTD